MAGYLDAYGASDARRERKIRWIVLGALGAVAIGFIAYFTFRHWGERQQAKAFIAALKRQDHRAAYNMFGCTQANPCSGFPFEKFLEDWGPQNQERPASQLSLGDSEPCGNGLLVNVRSGDRVVEPLLVDSATKVIGYAPWPECPEPRFRLWKWIRMKTGGDPKPR